MGEELTKAPGSSCPCKMGWRVARRLLCGIKWVIKKGMWPPSGSAACGNWKSFLALSVESLARWWLLAHLSYLSVPLDRHVGWSRAGSQRAAPVSRTGPWGHNPAYLGGWPCCRVGEEASRRTASPAVREEELGKKEAGRVSSFISSFFAADSSALMFHALMETV